ncbi:MAG: head-tail connector protein [Pseudomonadota bacterium]
MLTILTPPAVEPVSIDEAKRHLRLSSNAEDAAIARLIAAARRVVEERTGRALVAQAARLTLDAPPADVATFPRAPVLSFDAVEVETEAGQWSAVDPGLYAVETGEGARIAATGFWPRPASPIAGVRIDASVGYGGAGAAPEELQQAVLLLTAHLYERREPADDGRVYVLPHSIEAMLASYRRPRL